MDGVGRAAVMELRWRWALEAATAPKANKRAAAQGEHAGGRSRAGLEAAGGDRVSRRWASQNTNRQMGVYGCLNFFYMVNLVPHCPPIGVETCLYVFLCM